MGKTHADTLLTQCDKWYSSDKRKMLWELMLLSILFHFREYFGAFFFLEDLSWLLAQSINVAMTWYHGFPVLLESELRGPVWPGLCLPLLPELESPYSNDNVFLLHWWVFLLAKALYFFPLQDLNTGFCLECPHPPCLANISVSCGLWLRSLLKKELLPIHLVLLYYSIISACSFLP